MTPLMFYVSRFIHIALPLDKIGATESAPPTSISTNMAKLAAQLPSMTPKPLNENGNHAVIITKGIGNKTANGSPFRSNSIRKRKARKIFNRRNKANSKKNNQSGTFLARRRKWE